MVKLNKYLRELGIDENHWLFNKEDIETDIRYQEDEEGFKDAEFFSLDNSLSLYIYSQLCYFREHCLVGYPAYLGEEKWKEILDKMIEAFRLMIIGEEIYYHGNDKEKKILSKNAQKKINYGMRLFIKYYHDLWY